MHKVLDLLDQIVLPKVVFNMTSAESEDIRFEFNSVGKPLEGDDEISKIINDSLKNALSFQRVNGKFVYQIDKKKVIERVNSVVREFHIKLWMAVNKKTQWNRTSLKKNMCYANSEAYKEKVLELFLDAAKYGISKDSLGENTEIKPIHKFIASKFQAMVEAQCPR